MKNLATLFLLLLFTYSQLLGQTCDDGSPAQLDSYSITDYVASVDYVVGSSYFINDWGTGNLGTQRDIVKLDFTNVSVTPLRPGITCQDARIAIEGENTSLVSFALIPSCNYNATITLASPVTTVTTGNFYLEVYTEGEDLFFDTDDDYSISIGQIDVYSCPVGVPLPVTYASIDIQEHNESLLLKWNLLTELNNSGFEVQRSQDGIQFDKIGWVEGSGSNNIRTPYQFTDTEIKPNVKYYYRLKQIDTDNKSSLSKVVIGQIIDNEKFVINQPFPNPSSDGNFSIVINSGTQKAVIFNLYDTTGKLITSLNKDVTIGQEKHRLDFEGVIDGIYYLQVISSDSAPETFKVVIGN